MAHVMVCWHTRVMNDATTTNITTAITHQTTTKIANETDDTSTIETTGKCVNKTTHVITAVGNVLR